MMGKILRSKEDATITLDILVGRMSKVSIELMSRSIHVNVRLPEDKEQENLFWYDSATAFGMSDLGMIMSEGSNPIKLPQIESIDSGVYWALEKTKEVLDRSNVSKRVSDALNAILKRYSKSKIKDYDPEAFAVERLKEKLQRSLPRYKINLNKKKQLALPVNVTPGKNYGNLPKNLGSGNKKYVINGPNSSGKIPYNYPKKNSKNQS